MLDSATGLDTETAVLTRLQRYIADRMRDEGLTQAEVSRRSGVSKAHLSWLLSGDKVRIPDPDLLDKIAGALRIPRQVLRRVAAESYGYSLPGPDDDAALLIASIENLPEDRRRDIAALVEMYRREADQRSRGTKRDRDKGTT